MKVIKRDGRAVDYNRDKIITAIKKANNFRQIKGYNKFTKINITCAGMPPRCYKYVKWDNFHEGLTCPRKITIYTRKRWGNIKRRRLYNKRRKNVKIRQKSKKIMQNFLFMFYN